MRTDFPNKQTVFLTGDFPRVILREFPLSNIQGLSGQVLPRTSTEMIGTSLVKVEKPMTMIGNDENEEKEDMTMRKKMMRLRERMITMSKNIMRMMKKMMIIMKNMIR